MIYLKIYVIIAAVCWFVFYGINFAYWTRKWKVETYFEDMSNSIIFSLFAAIIWPFGILLIIRKLGYGFRIK